jgi:hypothetical protein
MKLVDPSGKYGINPDHYNPQGTNPCDGRGPMCAVDITGDGPEQEKAGKAEIAKARGKSKRFDTRYDQLDRRTKHYRLHFTEDSESVILDQFVEKAGGGGYMKVDLSDLARRPDGANRYDITAIDTLAKAASASRTQ